MTKYARDEFDRVPETSTRQGVHRAAAESPRRRRLGPILAVGTLALLVGLVAYLILPKLGFNSAGNTAAVTAEQPAGSATASPAPTEASPAPASEATAGAGTPSETPSQAPSPEAAVVDKTQPVAVYNATGTPGLASRVGATVAADGWTLGPLGNWGGGPQTGSVIFYDGPAQKAGADALAALLGIQTVVESAEFNMPLVVVLGPGFQ